MRNIRYVKEKIWISVAYGAAVLVFAVCELPCVFQFLWHIPFF